MSSSHSPAHGPAPASTLPAVLEIAAGAGLTVVAAVAVSHATALPATFVVHAALAFGLVGAVVWSARYYLGLGGGLGPANRVTLARAGLLALLAGFVPVAGAGGATGWPFALALAALVLDGVDGAVARRTGSASAFGARFDMELDAALGLVLAVLVLAYDRAGAWVLLLGLPRYAFLAAGAAWPALRRPLPPSRRRQAVCVVQVAALALALAPGLGAPVAGLTCVLAGVALYASFAVDVRELARLAAVPTPRESSGDGS